MSCGCLPAEHVRANAIICGLCTSKVTCPASGNGVELHIRGVPCPKGKLPGRDGTVRWLGMVWMGVPWPQRVWAWTLGFSDKDREDFCNAFPGCGCNQWLKTRWLVLLSKVLGE